MVERNLEKSFIPKPGGARASTFSLSSIVGSGIFFVVLIIALGVFLYGQYIDNSNAELERKISEEADQIDEDELAELTAFDARLNSVQKLLDNHIAASRVLKLLGETTVTSIQFNALEFNAGGSAPSVRISGLSPDFRSVAAQVGILRANDEFVKTLISELSIEEEEVGGGDIAFIIDAQMRSDVIRYTASTNDMPEIADEDNDDDTATSTPAEGDEDNTSN